MAKASAARQLGDDYQARLFWYHASRLFLPHEDVVSVGFEVDEPLGFDDLVVNYGSPHPDGMGNLVLRDYYQVKFHLTQDGSIGHQCLIDPSFIGTASASLLQRLNRAHALAREAELRCRYYFVTPWTIHSKDPLAKLRDNTTEGLRLDKLSVGTPKSEMGAVRLAWREHLQLATDEELLDLLATFRLSTGAWSFPSIRESVNDRLMLAGFRPIPPRQTTFPYDTVIRNAFYSGVREFDRESLKDLAQREDLWVGTPDPEPNRPKVIAVRSFTKWTQQIADRADDYLDLVGFFNGRHILDDDAWTSEVWSSLVPFLENAAQDGDATYDLHLDAHTTIAFAAGYALAKVPTSVTPIQRTGPSASIRWAPTGGPSPEGDPWTIAEESIPGSDPAHLALAISVTHDVFDDVRAYLAQEHSSIGRVLLATPTTGSGRTAVRDGTHAWQLAETLVHRLRKERNRRAPGSPLHIFIAAPNALTFFLGQQASLLGGCQLYEYDFDMADLGAYKASLLVPPVASEARPSQEDHKA
ncbi:MAG: SAVED domain-containing protein [Thermomicrobiales bacterium]